MQIGTLNRHLWMMAPLLFCTASPGALASPFQSDPHIRARCERLLETVGPELLEEARHRLLANSKPDMNLVINDGGLLYAGDVEELKRKFAIKDTFELMRLLLPLAGEFSDPVISGYRVGAIGLEKESGVLLFGGNLEFRGHPLAQTVHAEQAVFARAFARRQVIEAVALDEANPCAHCRQFMKEFSDSAKVRFIDPRGHDISLAELYPWPFDAEALGQPGITARSVTPTVRGDATSLPDPQFEPGTRAIWAPRPTVVRQTLLRELRLAQQRSYAPYTQAKSSVAILTNDNKVLTGSYIENVAFNPSLAPLQAALVNLMSHHYTYGDIRTIVLGQVRGGPVDHAPATRALAETIAPYAAVEIAWW